MGRNCQLAIHDENGRELANYKVPYGTKILVEEDSKVNHLSYIGDSIIGRSTNIGAGTITANFDGQKKHQTKIGKNSSIGANTVFVAPINLGESVTTGAGSVITKDSKDNSLAISRTKQVNIENWERKKS